MKKLAIILSVLIAGSPFVSCKKMKDDIKDLKGQVSDLEKQNDSLKNDLNGVKNAIGSDEPITATTTFTDDDGKTRTVTGIYKFKASDRSTQSMTNNNDGTYDIYIERFSDVNWNEGVYTSFTYNPTSKAVTNVNGAHYWSDADPYYDNAYWTGTGTGLTIGLTVDSLNMTTGAISIKFAASATAAYTSSVSYWYFPNQGAPAATTFSFAGKLKLFNTN